MQAVVGCSCELVGCGVGVAAIAGPARVADTLAPHDGDRLSEPPLPDGQDAVRQRFREIRVVRRNQNRRPLVSEVPQGGRDDLTRSRVESAGRLVDEQHSRRRGELQCERQASALAGREIERMPRHPFREFGRVGLQSEQTREAAGHRPRGGMRAAVGAAALVADGIAHEEVVRGVRDECGAARSAPRPDRVAGDGDVGGSIRKRDGREQARLAGAVRTDQGDDLSGANGERRVLDRDSGRVALVSPRTASITSPAAASGRAAIAASSNASDSRSAPSSMARRRSATAANSAVRCSATTTHAPPRCAMSPSKATIRSRYDEVEVGERLVDEEEDRTLGDGGRDRHERGFARGQSAQSAVEKMTDADNLGHLVDPRLDDDPRDTPKVECEADLVAHPLGRESLARLLQDDADALCGVAWGHGCPVVADHMERARHDPAVQVRQETAQRPEHHGLARSRRAGDHREGAGREGQLIDADPI